MSWTISALVTLNDDWLADASDQGARPGAATASSRSELTRMHSARNSPKCLTSESLSLIIKRQAEMRPHLNGLRVDRPGWNAPTPAMALRTCAE